MKHYGNIIKINGADVPLVDIVCGGSPCQDLSVAGKREGLAGERSGLFMEQIRIIKEMRNECIRQLSMRGADEPIRPRFMVWENVPGAISSNNGEDFRAVLEETAKIADENASIPRPEGGRKWTSSGCILGDGWTIAWRVHDAQFWGVPQRRKRIALVADFGGTSASEILFERKSLSGDSEQIGEEGQGVTTNFKGSVGETGKCLNGCGAVYDASRRHNYEPFGEVCGTVQAHYGTGGGNIPIVLEGNGQRESHRGDGFAESDTMFTGIVASVMTMQAIGEYKECGVASSCKQRDYKDATDLIMENAVVRRLTPLECERLQGYPDGWTDIGEWIDSKGKKHKDSDSPRYKALGNSIALPFWEWMAERMVNVLKEDGVDRPTMASLFDGIGGFPLVYSRCGCEPLWASEIEEFPIAVTKRRFPEEE